MSVLRPLPARPSLEYARKEAKALLRRLRAGDPDAIALAGALYPHARSSSTDARLADAQVVVARVHGVASWPKLVRYMAELERQQHAHVQLHGDPAYFESHARNLLAQHRAREPLAGRTFAAYVPRLYGASIEEVFASDVDEADARLAVARSYGAPSWEVLLERIRHDARNRTAAWKTDPMRRAANAMESGDVRALEQIVDAHPELLRPSEYDISSGHTLMWIALGQEKKHGLEAMHAVMAWLEGHGFDRQRELDLRLCGHVRMRVDEVNDLLERGANPEWIAPSGIPVLEHALLRYWNGDAVDVLAARAAHRDAFWIAAGLGDVDAVGRFLDRQGKPTSAARAFRPDFVAVGARGVVPHPEPDDDEILIEALHVAVLNGRARVIEYLASRGAPVNSLVYGMPLVTLAAANGMIAALEALVRAGADLDLRGWTMKQTAREIARELLLLHPEDAGRRRIVELCGMDPDAIVAERDAQPPKQPTVGPNLRRAMSLASADAAFAGRTHVAPENLLIGLLRLERLALGFVKDAGRMDIERFRAELVDRLVAVEPATDERDLPLSAELREAIDAALAHAAAHRREVVGELDVLQALLRDEDGAVSALLAGYGADLQKLRSSLDDAVGRSNSVRWGRKAKR
jgi:hypothetical protein